MLSDRRRRPREVHRRPRHPHRSGGRVIELGDHVPRGQLRVVEHLRHVADGTRGDAVLIEPIEGVLRRQIGERGVEFGFESVPRLRTRFSLVPNRSSASRSGGRAPHRAAARTRRTRRRRRRTRRASRTPDTERCSGFAPHPSRRLAAREVVRRHVAGPCSLPVEQAHVDLLARPVAEFAF